MSMSVIREREFGDEIYAALKDRLHVIVEMQFVMRRES
jgi:hypothetical protein